MYKIYPAPRSVVYPGGTVRINEVRFLWDGSVPEQGYRISLSQNEQLAVYSDDLGRRYAESTLSQIREQSGDETACVVIEDEPAVKRRGMLIDISRDKVPKLDTVYRIIDILSGMRINEIQLYIQGYSYEYEGWKRCFPDETPITKDELGRIIDYADMRGITVIPNMNCLGHMDAWLAVRELNPLAECPEGFDFQGVHRAAGTIDPKNPQAIRFVRGLCDDLLSNFERGLFNANLDEPYELGQGRNRGRRLEAYTDHVRMLNSYANSKGFTMMMWGDVIFAHPETVNTLPKNTILLDWIYESSARFERHAEIAAKSGFKFYVCPGTSTWCSFLGRSDNMRANIRDAAETAVKYGAYGMMTTDWGDLGHLQYLPISYAGYAFAGAYGWNPETTDDTVFGYLNSRVFKDPSGRFAQALYDLGNYYKEEKTAMLNMTESFYLMTRKYAAPTKAELDAHIAVISKRMRLIAEENAINFNDFTDGMDGGHVSRYINERAEAIRDIKLNCADGNIIVREVINGAAFAAHGARLHSALSAEDKGLFAGLITDLERIIAEHAELWKARNKPGGYARSAEQLFRLISLYEQAVN